MSSPATDVTIAEPAVKPPRKFPPPCWTQEETLCLIEAYRERWYALRRGYLRTADWDEVAVTVSTRCPGVSPAKTSAQCRHKMEKLRQRYRAEKQRSLSYPYPAGRYFSSWFFFDNMDAMENGTTAPTSKPGDDNMMKLKLKTKYDPDSCPDFQFGGNQIKPNRSKVLNDYPNYDEEDEDLLNFNRGRLINRIPTPPLNPNGGRTFRRGEDTSSFAGVSPMMNGLKRGRNPLEEIVDSIKVLGEGFVKMEKAKMEMAREMEMARMEMEMKRNEMMLESQKQIVEAFVKGLVEMKKVKTAVVQGDSAGGI